jgi:hypothetical protein
MGYGSQRIRCDQGTSIHLYDNGGTLTLSTSEHGAEMDPEHVRELRDALTTFLADLPTKGD